MASINGNPHAASIIAMIVFGFCFVPLAFVLRWWARRISAITFWWDDYLMAIALVRMSLGLRGPLPIVS